MQVTFQLPNGFKHEIEAWNVMALPNIGDEIILNIDSKDEVFRVSSRHWVIKYPYGVTIKVK